MSDVSTVSSGTASGSTTYVSTSHLDSEALIEAAVQQRLAPADRLEVEVSEEEARVAAYEELQDLSSAMTGSLNALRNPDDGSDDVFEETLAYLSSSSGTDPNTLVGVTTGEGAQTASHALEIVQVAEAHKISGSDVTSRDGDLGLVGSVSLSAASHDPVTVDVTADMSLDEIAEAINAQSETSGVAASVVKVSETAYRLVLSAEDTAKAISVSDTSGTVMQSLGVVLADGSVADELQAAQPAVVRLDGIEVTRDSNEIDDLLDGVTFYLYGAGSTVQVDVESDLSSVADAINGFVESYNAYRDFVLRHQEVGEDGTLSAEAALFGDTLLRNLNSQVSSILTTGNAGTLSSLGAIGLTFDENNYLVVDESALDEALLNDLEGVEALFQFQMNASSSALKVIRNCSGPAQQTFTLDITVDAGGAPTSASVSGDSTLFTVDGNRLIGAPGTEYDGLVLVFTGDQSTSIDIEISRGVADQLYNTISAYSDDQASQIREVIESAEDGIDAMQEQISDIERRAEDHRRRLIEYYAYLENKIAEATRLKDQLQALFDTDDD